MAWPRSGSGFALPRKLIASLALLTVPTVAAVFFRSGSAGLALRLWLVGVGALLFWAVSGAALRIWAVPESPGFTLPRTWRRRPPPERLRQLEELERAVDFALGTAFDLHFRLRPHLVRVATARLAARGVNLQAQPDRARALLGPDAWDLVRADREAPEDRAGPGVDLARLRSVVDQLDAI
jgi:hypothetical protein